MKKVLFVLLTVLLFTGCGKTTKLNDSSNISYTNKFECSRGDNYTVREVNQRNNSGHKSTADSSDDTGIGVEGKISKIYDFNKEGYKLLAFYEVGTYKYVMDTDMEKEKEYFSNKCSGYKEYGYKSCEVTLKDKTITIFREMDLNSEDIKESADSMTLESIKGEYAEGEIYTCS